MTDATVPTDPTPSPVPAVERVPAPVPTHQHEHTPGCYWNLTAGAWNCQPQAT